MPKEIINGESTHPGAEVGPFTQVTWGRESSYVQVATLASGDYNEVGGNERPGLYASLDRNGINRLIRALRKARDQAFGSDA